MRNTRRWARVYKAAWKRQRRKYAGNPKPWCPACVRRLYGFERMTLTGPGWWCGNCEIWIVKPPKRQRRSSR